MFGSTSTFSKPANKRMFGVFAGLALATQANAHLFIKYPAAPLEGPIKSPLDPSGSNFPCHGAQLPSSGGIEMAAGSSQLLQFDDGGGANTASHGGGSCQLSVYYDGDAKDPKNWKVIHSIEGGCPTNAEGNLPTAIQCQGGGGTDCYNSYNFTMPSGLQEGHAIFAWTWFNTIGNREMYMNCVNARITGGDGSEMNSLPSLFVANLASLGTCATSEQTNVKFPNPGKYVTSDNSISPYKIALASGGSCASDGAPAGGSALGGAAPSYGGGAPAAPSGGPNKPPAGNGGSGSGSGSATTMQIMPSGGAAPTSAPAPPAYSAPPAGAAPSAAPSAAVPAPYASGSGSSSTGSGSCPAGAQPCSNDGAVVCMGTQFGLCNQGCAVAQPLAAGTTCANGKVVKRDHVRRHVGRKHGRQFA